MSLVRQRIYGRIDGRSPDRRARFPPRPPARQTGDIDSSHRKSQLPTQLLHFTSLFAPGTELSHSQPSHSRQINNFTGLRSTPICQRKAPDQPTAKGQRPNAKGEWLKTSDRSSNQAKASDLRNPQGGRVSPLNRKSSPIGFRVRLGGIAGAVGGTQLSGIQNERIGSDRIESDLDVHLPGNIHHGRSQALRLTDAFLD
jgi:hypothetical protein